MPCQQGCMMQPLYDALNALKHQWSKRSILVRDLVCLHDYDCFEQHADHKLLCQWSRSLHLTVQRHQHSRPHALHHKDKLPSRKLCLSTFNALLYNAALKAWSVALVHNSFVPSMLCKIFRRFLWHGDLPVIRTKDKLQGIQVAAALHSSQLGQGSCWWALTGGPLLFFFCLHTVQSNRLHFGYLQSALINSSSETRSSEIAGYNEFHHGCE